MQNKIATHIKKQTLLLFMAISLSSRKYSLLQYSSSNRTVLEIDFYVVLMYGITCSERKDQNIKSEKVH